MHVWTTPSDSLDGYDFCILTIDCNGNNAVIKQQRRQYCRHCHCHRRRSCCRQMRTHFDLNWCGTLNIWIEDRRHINPLRWIHSTIKTLQWKNNDDDDGKNNNSVYLTDISRLQNIEYDFRNWKFITHNCTLFSPVQSSPVQFNSNEQSHLIFFILFVCVSLTSIVFNLFLNKMFSL